MENIYKIKIRSSPDPRDLYPSERRYSSSIVLGFSIVFLTLAVTSTLMGSLVVRQITTNRTQPEETSRENYTTYNVSREDDRFINNVEKDLFLGHNFESHYVNTTSIVSGSSFVMSLGLLLAGFTGIFAWKQWYMDKNITWFFLASCFSTITSSISVLMITLTILEFRDAYPSKDPEISWGLTANILITSTLGLLWSVCATKVSFKGMKSNYPDDIVISKERGRIQVNTVKKGNKIAKVIPPDILSNFPTSGKLAKYFPKKADNSLPKEESNREYEERVKKFLSGHSDSPDAK